MLITCIGLFVRPPYQGEQFANWEQSSAGLREDDSGWVYVPPEPGVFTVFPGKPYSENLDLGTMTD